MTPPGIRKSANSKRRAAVLIAIHVLIAAHIAQFMWSGRTLSPVEPSESMYALELGQINAGFLFLLVAMAATLVFGRFFCGWGCHLVALQDLCSWMMKKIGVRPRPFRSRLLMWVPAVAAFYMFAWPAFKRWGTVLLERWGGLAALERRDLLDLAREIGVVCAVPDPTFRGFSNHLMTDSFWKTFPGPLWAVLTLATCGFAAVYLLGAKGFCTYACPYGALFGAMDRFAPARIVVSDACEQCGHCTAVCTSNVLVHEEVRRYGTVVDPGCMKCLDCVSVCPNGALSYGLARPSVLKRKPTDQRAVKRYNLSLGEEFFVFAVWLLTTGALRGLYGRFPLLMSIGLGAMTAFMALKLWHLLRRPNVRVQNLQLKTGGRWANSGRVFAVVTVIWLLFIGDGALAQWHGKWGDYHLNRTQARKADVFDGSFSEREYGERHDRAAERSFLHFRLADRPWRPSQTEIKLGLAWGYLLRDDRPAAEREIQAALQIAPQDLALHDEWIEFLASDGRFDEAIAAVGEKMEVGGVSASGRLQVAGLLMRAGRHAEGREELVQARHQAEADADGQVLRELANAYGVLGDLDTALALSRAALAVEPDSAEGRFQLAGLLVRLGSVDEAVEEYRACIELLPEAQEVRFNLGALLRRMGREDEAIDQLETALSLAPDDLATRIELGLAYMAAERNRDALESLQRATEMHPDSPAVQWRLPGLIEELRQRVAADPSPD